MSFVVKPFVLPVCGQLGIHGYGLTVLAAVVLFCTVLYVKLKRIYPLSWETIGSVVVGSIGVGVAGGRLLYVLFDRDPTRGIIQIFEVWNGGLSILGVVAALCLYVPFKLKRKNIPLFPVLDIAAVCAPLAHAIGRLGCLWAGCCFGCGTAGSCAVTYHGITAGAPIDSPLMPIQLYSALLLFVLFLALNVLVPVFLKKSPGVLVLLYIIGISLERFGTDFWRNDRQLGFLPFFSVYQWIALVLAVGALLLLIGLIKNPKRHVKNR